MRIALYDPYLDTVGGGERYICTIAECLSLNHEVDLLWNDSSIKEKLVSTFRLNLNKVNFAPNVFMPSYGILNRLRFLSRYDRLFYLSDGSLPWVSAKKNFLHFQFPITGIKNISLIDQLKLKQFSHVICNSNFTKGYIDRTYQVKSKVVYPPVDINKFSIGDKQKIILSVSRFTKTIHHKKQDLLISAFKKIYDLGFKDWKLILAGGVSHDEIDIINNLKKSIGSYPIEICENISFPDLQSSYSTASIYWHGAGFGVDIEKEPQNTEHFGITIVEAMASGCVPLVVGNGGQTEIVENGLNGFTYFTQDELIEKTINLIKDPTSQIILRQNAIKKSKLFSKERFGEEIIKIMETS